LAFVHWSGAGLAAMIHRMPIPEFKIEVGAVPGLEDGVLLSFNGPIDAKNIADFQVQMDALRKRQYRRFLLQMAEVRYINSGGLAYLINMVESAQAAGGALVLFEVQPKVKVILETMGLTALLRIYPSKASAVRDLKASAGSRPAPAVPASEPAPGPGTIRRLFRRIFGPPGDRRV
jgi:anti-anti-sigma factor